MVSSSDNLQSPTLGGMAATAGRNDVVVQNASWSGTAPVSVTCMSRRLYAQEVRIPERSGFLATVLSRADRPIYRRSAGSYINLTGDYHCETLPSFVAR